MLLHYVLIKSWEHVITCTKGFIGFPIYIVPLKDLQQISSNFAVKPPRFSQRLTIMSNHFRDIHNGQEIMGVRS
jgi:hypothetical protein